MIDEKSIEKTRKAIKSAGNCQTIKAQNPEYNRKIIEYGGFSSIMGIEDSENSDSVRSINSGMNEILARIAKKNSVSFSIDLGNLRNRERKEKAEYLKKLLQNIKICRKTGAKLSILNYRDKRNAKSLLLSLGASTQQASETICF